MMLLNRSILASLIVLAACNTNKKNSATAVPVAETATVTKDTAKTAPSFQLAETYHGSNPRTNDLLHTKLEVAFDWTNSRMNGKAVLTLKPYFLEVNSLYLNARGMDIQRLEVFELKQGVLEKKDGKKSVSANQDSKSKVNSSYTYENDSLKINLGRYFKASENYLVEIDYVAKPNELAKAGGSQAISDDKGLYFINPTGERPHKMPQIWTQGETQSNSVWFPTIDSPNERMTQDIYMTVEDRFTTLSNGLLVDSKKEADGRRTDHWQLDQPHAPYLAMMAVGSFKKVLGDPWNGKEVSYYVDPEYEIDAKDIFGDTREMIDFYSNKLGVPYAWPKYAQIVAHDYVSGAMENTSATLHGDFMVYQTAREMVDGKKGTDVIAHELFHQWFGDLVTCESWSNLPLNESFATYGEYLWEEYKNGRLSADEHHYQSRQGYIASNRDAHPIRFDYGDKEAMFDAVSYNKGGQILHMLRKAVGDPIFFAGLKNYLETNKFKSVEIHNLRLAFEEVSGQDLNWFFNQWFLAEGRPDLKVTVAEKKNGFAEMIVEQRQDLKKMPLYRLPVDIDIYLQEKVVRKRIIIENQIDTFLLKLDGPLQFINFDAERQLLCDLTYKKSMEQLLTQYNLGPLFVDRLEALKYLESKTTDAMVLDLFARAAEYDKSVLVRQYALSRIEKFPTDVPMELKTLLIRIYNSDKNTLIRAKALQLLNKRHAEDPEVKDLVISALREQSYAICGEALTALSKTDKKMAMKRAKDFENESGAKILFPVANLYADNGGDEQLLFFHNALYRISGFEVLTFISIYSKLAKKSSDANSAIIAACDFDDFSIGAHKFVKIICTKSLNELIATWTTNANDLQKEIDAAKAQNKDTSALQAKLKEANETKSIIEQKLKHVN